MLLDRLDPYGKLLKLHLLLNLGWQGKSLQRSATAGTGGVAVLPERVDIFLGRERTFVSRMAWLAAALAFFGILFTGSFRFRRGRDIRGGGLG
jgi:hypothetical protein